jgi:hypothetical protein
VSYIDTSGAVGRAQEVNFLEVVGKWNLPLTPTHPLSSFTQGTNAHALGESISMLRGRELAAFAVDRNSRIGTCLAAVRGELQRLLAGKCVRADVIERALAPPSELLEGAGFFLVTASSVTEVHGA